MWCRLSVLTLLAAPSLRLAFVADWDHIYLYEKPENDGVVWSLSGAQLTTTGWELTTGTWGGYGRKVFIKGALQGTGCWFSTDYLASDTCGEGGGAGGRSPARPSTPPPLSPPSPAPPRAAGSTPRSRPTR